MSFLYAFTCDVCGATESAQPTEGYWSYSEPKGWRRMDRRDLCSLGCVALYATTPDDYPAQVKLPDPFVAALTQAVKK